MLLRPTFSIDLSFGYSIPSPKNRHKDKANYFI